MANFILRGYILLLILFAGVCPSTSAGDESTMPAGKGPDTDSVGANQEILAVVADLALTVKKLSSRLKEIEEQNEELSETVKNLQVASKDLLYERFLEYFDNEIEEYDMYDDESDDSTTHAALWFLRHAAEAGHANGQLQLGLLYDSGYPGLNQSNALAVVWYLRAALQDLPEAQCYLGMAYHLGRGVNQSDISAIKWYRIAAENDDPIAQNNLGWMLLTGGKSEKTVTAQEELEAVEWFKRAAKNGEPFGLANLGLCYTIGAGGLPVDHNLALDLYRQMNKKDIQRYGSVALSETPVWRSNMMQWFSIAADAGESIAILILEIHNLTDYSGELYASGSGTNVEQSM